MTRTCTADPSLSGLREPGNSPRPSATSPTRPIRGLLADGVAGRVAEGDPDGAGCCCDAAGDSCSVAERDGADDSVCARVDLRDGARPVVRPDGTGADRDREVGLLGGEIEPVEDMQRLRVDFE